MEKYFVICVVLLLSSCSSMWPCGSLTAVMLDTEVVA